DSRLVAATNLNLDEMARLGIFRSDLLYRIRSFNIELPPLRERKDDIPELIAYHMAKICERYGEDLKTISAELMEMLIKHDWPGNVREMFNVLERTLAVARMEPVLIPKHLPVSIRAKIARNSVSKAPSQTASVAQSNHTLPGWQEFRELAINKIEKQYLQDLLTVAGDNIKKACEISNLSRSRLYELLKKYQVNSPPLVQQ
ncbi:MAG: helix-turn-helix domain-containing protein, partial [Syntrophales bacterium]|nr:helix-turn-helix domain-containing protein [Syntrophales bacterium]